MGMWLSSVSPAKFPAQHKSEVTRSLCWPVLQHSQECWLCITKVTALVLILNRWVETGMHALHHQTWPCYCEYHAELVGRVDDTIGIK